MRIFHWIQHWKNVVATTILYLVCVRESSAQGQGNFLQYDSSKFEAQRECQIWKYVSRKAVMNLGH